MCYLKQNQFKQQQQQQQQKQTTAQPGPARPDVCVCVLMDLSEAQRLDDEWTPAKQHPKHICFLLVLVMAGSHILTNRPMEERSWKNCFTQNNIITS